MRVVCVDCRGEEEAGTGDSTCPRCGTVLKVAGRWVALPRTAAQRADGLDEVDGAAPLYDGRDEKTGEPVCLRVAGEGEMARLEREATVLRGLHVTGVPRVRALERVGPSAVLVTDHVGVPVERSLADGLRIDAVRARQLLRGALDILAGLHALSPPVFHRHVHSGTVTWDGRGPVGLRDFARATDTVEDHAVDRVLPRPGFHATAPGASAAQQDLHGLGAVAVHVLSRRPPDALPQREGLADFRPHVTVDEPLADFIERLLSAGKRRGFASAAEALAALPPAPGAPSQQSGGGFPIALVAGVLLLVGAGGGAFMALKNAATSTTVTTTTLVTHEPPTPPQPRTPTPPEPPAPVPPPRTVAPPMDDITLKITSTPPGARVTLDGTDRGTTPLELRVPPTSRAEARLSLAGHDTAVLKLVLLDDVTQHVTLNARAAAPAPAAEIPVVPRVDDAWRKAVERAVNNMQPQLVPCGADGNDRVRVRLRVPASGAVERVEPLAQARLESTTCVKALLEKTTFPTRTDRDAVTVDVWVYFKPAFRVAVY